MFGKSQNVQEVEMARAIAGCFVDFFEKPNFGGKLRRLPGPARYPMLRAPAARVASARSSSKQSSARAKSVREIDPGVAIESIIVGRGAYLLCYDSGNFAGTAHWLRPREKVESWRKRPGLSETIDSFEITSRAPTKGQLGYEALARK